MMTIKNKLSIVAATHGFSESIFKVGSCHLAKWWNKMGHDVLSITVPVSFFHFLPSPLSKKEESTLKLKASRRGVYHTEEGYKEFVPFSLIPFKDSFFFRLFQNQNHFILQKMKKELAQNGYTNVDYLFLENPSFNWLIDIVQPRKIIYRVTDKYSTMGNESQVFWKLEKSTINKADKIITTSIGIKDHLEENYQPKKEILVVENGVDLENFAPSKGSPNKLTRKYKINLVYVGALDYRIDFEFLLFAAQSFPDIGFHLYGSGTQNFNSFPENVRFHGPVAYKELGTVLPNYDIGILPFNNHPANEGRSPMKLYEYGICGLPTLGKSTSDLKKKSKENPSILLYTDFTTFSDSLNFLLTNLDDLSVKASSLAKEEAWEKKARLILEFVEK